MQLTQEQRQYRDDALTELLGLNRARSVVDRLERQERRATRYEFKRHAFRATALSGGGAKERARRAKKFA
jgi:hypothetical protein